MRMNFIQACLFGISVHLARASNYEFGEDCASLTDELCSEVANCSQCAWSWPVGSDWSDRDAACRCKSSEESNEEPKEESNYEFGEDCASLTDELCSEVANCSQCAWSWPVGSDWSDRDAACRCKSTSDGSDDNDNQTRGDFPELKVLVDGTEETLYVVYDETWSQATTDSNSLAYDYNNRMYLSTVNAVDPYKLYKPNLLGGSISFTVDLSKSGCGCVSALYAILMPAEDNYNDPFKYCDANQVGGHFCPEFDIMEANKYAFRSTGHKCDQPNAAGIYDNCDRGGQCHFDVLEDMSAMDFGPGPLYKINTENPFNVGQYFEEDNGVFTGYSTIISQGTNQIVHNVANCQYLSNMSSDMTRMVISLSNWGSGSLQWLQHGVCQGQCSRTDTMTHIMGIQITTKDNPNPSPSPAPSPKPTQPVEPVVEYVYENKCDKSECGGSEDIECHFSWPLGENRRSSEAKCRTLPKQRAPHSYKYGSQCASDTEGTCVAGCNCRKSWPKDDSLKWRSAEKMCRCKPESPLNLTMSNTQCPQNYDGKCGADCHSCVFTVDQVSGDLGCHCANQQTQQIVWGELATQDYTAGECGPTCFDCRWSWLASDTAQSMGDSATYRCRNWSPTAVVDPQVDVKEDL